MLARRAAATAIVAMLALALGLLAVGSMRQVDAWPTPGPPTPWPTPMPTGEVRLGVPIARGSTLGAILNAHGLPVQPIRDAALPWHDLAQVRPDRELMLVYTDGRDEPAAVRYAIDDDRTVVVERVGDAWAGRLEVITYTTRVGTRDLLLEHSLWADGLDAGLRPDDLVRLAKIFEYEIDFNTELQKGARFSLVAEILEPDAVDDPFVSAPSPRLGTIHAVRITNGAKETIAVRFELPDGEAAWFHPDGSGMKRPFLRSPLEFSRVTSGFNPKRFHPVLKKARPHNGTDFGAPTGTPVRSVADGKVVYAGTSGGHGKFVKVEHEGGYATSYSHLSRVDVKVGQKIRQSSVIGAVGTTGMSTGPHLHYQMWKGSRYVDPMKIDLPNTSALPVSQKEAFAKVAAEWVPQLPE